MIKRIETVKFTVLNRFAKPLKYVKVLDLKQNAAKVIVIVKPFSRLVLYKRQ